uniref:Uncharacterized protein LOC116946108 isoform X2 n=1 Tax=Petromyzon marinus TaxID=7757 RepID=A0AAJ7X1S6_PETMA|nr:uncharacterized protein LOC116946108 isoform X2 [Petromyzon marinus]
MTLRVFSIQCGGRVESRDSQRARPGGGIPSRGDVTSRSRAVTSLRSSSSSSSSIVPLQSTRTAARKHLPHIELCAGQPLDSLWTTALWTASGQPLDDSSLDSLWTTALWTAFPPSRARIPQPAVRPRRQPLRAWNGAPAPRIADCSLPEDLEEMDFQRNLKQQKTMEVMNDDRRRFVRSAGKFIMVVYTYGRQEVQKGRLNKQDFRSYLNEGQLQQPSVDPERMFPNQRALSAMRSLTAFTMFRSRTPKRMPGSVLLQMVEQIEGSHSKQEILKTLALLATNMLVNDAGGGGGEDDSDGGDDGSGGVAVLNVLRAPL